MTPITSVDEDRLAQFMGTVVSDLGGATERVARDLRQARRSALPARTETTSQS